MKLWKLKKLIQFFPFVYIWWLDALKTIENIIQENAFEQEKKNTDLKFNASANQPSNNWNQLLKGWLALTRG